MTDYLTEQEQIEILKNWIKQYSLVIMAGIVIAILLVSGWRYWQQRQIKTLNHASAVYDEMLTMRSQNDPKATLVQANKLFNHYPKTVYGQMAALMLAREAISHKNYSEAKKQLTWVIDHSNVASLRQIARLRFARLLIEENKPQESLKLLQTIEADKFKGLTDEIKGDAYSAMHDTATARKLYQQALAELPNAEIVRPLLRMKYDSLATTTNN